MIQKIIGLVLFSFILLMPGTQAYVDYIDNHSPGCGDTDVVITPSGQNTCVDIWIPNGCYANITFYWLNWTKPGWDTYAYWSFANETTQYCAWNENITCYIDGDIRTIFIWRVVAEYVCPQQNYSFTEYSICNFRAEPCPLFYIRPEHNSTDICPCCDAMCIGIENENGNQMNLTFYRNDTMNESFYIVNKYIYVDNGTYCFCLDGHMDDIYYPMRYNETYYWYVNVTDTATGEYEISNVYNFTTANNLSECPCGEEEIGRDIVLIKRDLFWYFLLMAVGILILLAFKKKNKIFYGRK